MLLGVNLFAQYPQPAYGPQGYPQQPPPPGYAPPGQGGANPGPYVAQQYPSPGYRPPYGAPQGGVAPYGPAPTGEENPDDPTRGVARMSLLQGEVNVRRGDSGELVAGALNAPLMSQDRLITGPGSFAEVQFDAANMIRLAPGTDAGMADLEYQRYQIQLTRGTIMYSIVRESQAQAEIDTPSVAIRPLRFGEYRVSVFDDGTTQVTVRAGEAEILGPQGSERFPEGRTMLIRSGPQGPEFQTSWAIQPDDFDQWNVGRDRQLQSSQSYRFVSADVPGAEDLDQYGQWTPSEYGQAWVPSNVPADWAPYRDGQWSWEDYYGWTWVDSAPWGWAPFHYGRWFQLANHWAWAPLALRGAANLWRPALVGFFGFGGIGGAAVLAASALGSLFSLFGNLGWSPLAPNEPFHAWYGRGYYNSYNRGGFGAANIARGANIAGMFRNARVGNGVSYASSANFGNGPQRFLAAGSNQLTQAGLVRGPLPLAPTRQSLAFSGRGAYSNAIPAARGGETFFSRMQGTAVSRVPFATQAGALQRFSQQTLGTTFNRGYTPGPGVSTQAFSRNSTGGGAGWPQAQTRGYNSGVRSPESNASGWHSFGQTNGDARGNFVAPRSYSGSTESSNGWHVFGQPHQSNELNRGGPGSYGSGYTAQQGPARSYYGGGSGYAGGNGQALRLNQPMVQPRGYASQNPSYGGSRNYSASPAPRSNYSAPHYSAPHYNAPKSSAPKSSGGGSHGGGSHGGGGHSKGGGGHHK
jgi:FecR protein